MLYNIINNQYQDCEMDILEHIDLIYEALNCKLSGIFMREPSSMPLLEGKSRSKKN